MGGVGYSPGHYASRFRPVQTSVGLAGKLRHLASYRQNTGRAYKFIRLGSGGFGFGRAVGAGQSGQ